MYCPFNEHHADRTRGACNRKGDPMLQTLTIILLVLWLLGLVSSHTMGGFIHILLVIAVVMVLVRVIQGRKI